MKQLIVSIFLLFNSLLFSQNLTTNIQSKSLKLTATAEISIITCGPGKELYTAFGHSAFRVRDPKLGIDKIYNYGTFDYKQPNFYGNFAKGNTIYFLGVADTGRFLRIYQYEKRWVKGQVLDLQPADVQQLYNYLENNSLLKNRDYLYNYFFDNCSTRLVDVIEVVLGEKLSNPTNLFTEDNLTHRELMQLYLGNNAWGDFGIDLALGSPIDRKATPKEYLFLPENVFAYFDALKIKETINKSKPIVKRTEVILPESNKIVKKSFFTPFILFSIIGLIVVIITRKDIQKKQRTRWLDFSLFFITGSVGLGLLLIWFATNHISAANNFNVLWAFAPNLIISFILLKKKLPNWIRKYIQLLLILLAVVVLLWIFKYQIFSNATLPILLFLGVRYYYLLKHFDYVKN